MMRRRLPLVAAWWLTPLAALLSSPTMSVAQLIPVKTVPLATGDQFEIFPSLNRGMGSVSIAMDDPLLDPFVNPAKGGRLRDSRLFLMPTFYDITDDLGAARSLPAGALFRAGDWFGAFALSLQELDGPEPPPFIFFETLAPGLGLPATLSAQSGNNLYAFGSLGHRLTETRVSIGGSIFWAGLDALEGVGLLFPTTPAIDQSGHVLDLRVGLTGDLNGGRTWEMLLLHHSQDMTYEFDVFVAGDQVFPPRQPEKDRTDTWGAQLGYVAPLPGDGWRLGAMLTANYKDHPHIPNFELTNIPRDPGHTWAFDVGVGVARTFERTRFGIDLILEPIWSDTWAEAEAPIFNVPGGPIPAGAKTVENEFRFTNALMRMGVGYDADRAGFELGLQVSAIDYTLEQADLVLSTRRKQDESWMEWTPTWGFGVAFDGFDVHYTGHATVGTGQPGVLTRFIVAPQPGSRSNSLASTDYLVAPFGPLTLQDASVFTHQVYVTVPIGD